MSNFDQIFASRRKLNIFSHSSRPRLLSSPSASPNIQIQRLNSDTSDVSLNFCHVSILDLGWMYISNDFALVNVCLDYVMARLSLQGIAFSKLELRAQSESQRHRWLELMRFILNQIEIHHWFDWKNLETKKKEETHCIYLLFQSPRSASTSSAMLSPFRFEIFKRLSLYLYPDYRRLSLSSGLSFASNRSPSPMSGFNPSRYWLDYS